jgi:hypothetical protein
MEVGVMCRRLEGLPHKSHSRHERFLHNEECAKQPASQSSDESQLNPTSPWNWGKPNEAAKWRKLQTERLTEGLLRNYVWPLCWGWPLR